MRPDSEFDAFLARHVNEVLRRGSFAAAMMGIVCGGLLAALLLAGVVQGLWGPAFESFATGCAGLVVWGLARGNLLRGWRFDAAMLPFSLAPTLFFLLANLSPPSSTASYITGPFSYLYFVIILMTGFTLERRLAWVAGVLSAGGYLFSYALARSQLALLSHPDPVLVQDLTGAPIYVLKAMMMLFTGLITGAIAKFTRELIYRVRAEELRRTMVDRLFGEYVSQEVREKLLADPGHVRGERREVAILFADLRGFSTFSEQHPPEEIVARLNAWFDRMVGALTSHGGVVDKFIGDALMGTFGGFQPVENPCDAAFMAALAMSEALAGLNAEWAEGGKRPFEHGVGLDFGEVVQGPLGSQRRKDFTVVGDAVNTASRAQGLTRQVGHPIVLTEAIYTRLSPAHRARCQPLGEVKVKGKARAVRIYGASGLVEAPLAKSA